MNPNDTIIAWLNDAHAMENALVQILEHQVKDAEQYPNVQAMLQTHLDQTRRHADVVDGCVQRLGGSTSSIKSGFASLFGQMQALSTGSAEDEMVKNALADYAAENFEVASYTSLITAAELVGDMQTATACRQILAEDQAMANWIEQNLPTLTQMTLGKMTAGVGS
jgi:ferritin-like metal-binding protein YciE